MDITQRLNQILERLERIEKAIEAQKHSELDEIERTIDRIEETLRMKQKPIIDQPPYYPTPVPDRPPYVVSSVYIPTTTEVCWKIYNISASSKEWN